MKNDHTISKISISLLSLLLPLILLTGFFSLVKAETTTTFTVTNTDDDGPFSLRWAVSRANSTPGDDVINFDSSLSGATIALITGDLLITDTVTIDGSRLARPVEISGQNLSRVFTLYDEFEHPFAVKMYNLVIKNGETMTTMSGSCLIYCGGGIYVHEGVDFLLRDSVVKDSFANSGGGILSDGTTRIINTIIKDNTSHYDGGGIRSDGLTVIQSSLIEGNTANGLIGGGINSSQGDLTIRLSTVINNQVLDIQSPDIARGGGVGKSIGTITIARSTISDNVALDGGGIALRYNTESTLFAEIDKSTISSNGAINNGGGIWSDSNASKVLIEINNSTLSNNVAGNEEGGAVHLIGGGVEGTIHMTMTNSTIYENSANTYGGVSAVENDLSTVTALAKNTIIAGNSVTNCIGVTGNAYSLSDDGSCTGFTQGDPMLGPLQDNGGPTYTHMPAFGSPAINGADVSVCNAVPIDSEDQRSEPRPFDKCDIGALEFPNFEIYLPTMQKD